LNINYWGVCGIVLSAAGFILWSYYEAASLHLRCIPYTVLQLTALVCSIVAAMRGNKQWLWLSGILGILSAQALLALVVEC